MSSTLSLSEGISQRLWNCGDEGVDTPVVVAEISTNHRGSLQQGRALIAAAKEAGADAVKIQSYQASDLTIDSARAEFLLHHPLWSGRRLFELYEEGALPDAWLEALWEEAGEREIVLFASVFSEARLRILSRFSDFAYKIASAELVDLALVEAVAKTGSGIILSTGMANDVEIGRAVEVVRRAGNEKLILLHCLSAYPAERDAMNLRAIGTLRERFGYRVGLSDHTRDARAAELAVAMGACLIEKHFTIERREGDLDYAFSLDCEEFADFVGSVREASKMLGGGRLEASESEAESLLFRRSLYVVRAMKRGESFTRENVRAIRPNNGMAPFQLSRVLCCRASRDIDEGVPLCEDMMEQATK